MLGVTVIGGDASGASEATAISWPRERLVGRVRCVDVSEHTLDIDFKVNSRKSSESVLSSSAQLLRESALWRCVGGEHLRV